MISFRRFKKQAFAIYEINIHLAAAAVVYFHRFLGQPASHRMETIVLSRCFAIVLPLTTQYIYSRFSANVTRNVVHAQREIVIDIIPTKKMIYSRDLRLWR